MKTLIINNLKTILESLSNWINEIKKLTYSDIIKNVSVAGAILILIYYGKSIWMTEIISGNVLVFITSGLLVFLLGQYIFEIFKCKKKERKKKNEIDKIQQLGYISLDVDRAMEKSRMKLNASRILLYAYHNGQKCLGGAPFSKASVVKEVVDEDSNTEYIAEHFQQQMLGLYRFPQYVNTHPYFMGTSEDVKEIDFKFKQSMDICGSKYIACKAVKDKDGNVVGRVSVAFDEKRTIPSPERLKNELDILVVETRNYLIMK